MKKTDLNIFYSNSSMNGKDSNAESMTFEQLVRIAKSRDFFNYINKYHSVVFYCPSFTSFARPFLTAVICRLMTLGRCIWIDAEGKHKRIGVGALIGLFITFVYENVTYKNMLKKVNQELDRLSTMEHIIGREPIQGEPLYLRCDLSYGYTAGGSIGHIAGVLNNMEHCVGASPIFVSTDTIPTVDEKIEKHIIREKVPYGNVKDIASIAFNATMYNSLENILSDRKISFIYQRSALNAFSGMKYALKYNIPFILEYNGSEVWISNKWGGGKLKANDLSEKIERLTFEKADLITCVSAPLKKQLVEMGIDENKIMVNPNGVNPDMYSPCVDGSQVRQKIGVSESDIVIGFIGTFGAWHGADILAQAYADLVNKTTLTNSVHLLLVGDGLKMPDVKKVIHSNGIESRCTLTGVVPQDQGPEYLAACDILVSPQIRNADGTPFFGSPTKLFEYMAMGKAIVTSNMDQMAEIFEHEKTALLCEPGNVEELGEALKRLIGNKELRQSMGENARKEVCSKYTWKIHTTNIVRALINRLENSDV